MGWLLSSGFLSVVVEPGIGGIEVRERLTQSCDMATEQMAQMFGQLEQLSQQLVNQKHKTNTKTTLTNTPQKHQQQTRTKTHKTNTQKPNNKKTQTTHTQKNNTKRAQSKIKTPQNRINKKQKQWTPHLLLSVSTSRLWQVSTQHQHQLVALRLSLQYTLHQHLLLSTSRLRRWSTRLMRSCATMRLRSYAMWYV